MGYEENKVQITTKIITKILTTLVGTVWTDIAIPDCDMNVACFKRLIYPKCYWRSTDRWERIVVNGRPRLTRPYCEIQNPRPCGLEIITICYEDLYDENGNFERRVYHTERFFWPPIPVYQPGMCPHKCIDNCY